MLQIGEGKPIYKTESINAWRNIVRNILLVIPPIPIHLEPLLLGSRPMYIGPLFAIMSMSTKTIDTSAAPLTKIVAEKAPSDWLSKEKAT